VTPREPAADVLAAFGIHADAVLLPGGEGRTWRAGDAVIKPTGLPAETAWVAEATCAIPPSDLFRVATPIRATDGGWAAFGWEAWRAIPGQPDERRCDDVLRVGQAFHRSLERLPRPPFLDVRDNPWSYGDRLAWDELALTGREVMAELLMPLARARRPVESPSQVVHGDLLGNVMFADGLAPAVIDWPVYFRPASWALAVAVVDALTWAGETAMLMDRWAGLAEWDQMLLRALIYRIGTSEGCRQHGLPVEESVEDYRPVVDLVLARLR
jgi:uncharacterized protein (TIGR02569 family)